MSFELSTLFALGIGYLAILFGIAFITEKGWIPERVVRHPIVYVLSLGVFANAMIKLDRWRLTGETLWHNTVEEMLKDSCPI